jgi:hypothetical protein
MTNKSNDNSVATTIVGPFRGQFAAWGRWGRPKTASREVPFSEVLKVDEGRQILIMLCNQTQKGVASSPCTEVLHDRRRRIFLQPSNQRRNRFCLWVYTLDFGLESLPLVRQGLCRFKCLETLHVHHWLRGSNISLSGSNVGFPARSLEARLQQPISIGLARTGPAAYGMSTVQSPAGRVGFK